MHAALERRGLTNQRFRVATRPRGGRIDCSSPRAGSLAVCPEEKGSATGQPLLVARPFEVFARRLGARSIGVPVRHPLFPRYVIPMLADLDELPKATLIHFDPFVQHARAKARGLHAQLVQEAWASLRDLDRHPVGSRSSRAFCQSAST
jgi:hypothetical protein